MNHALIFGPFVGEATYEMCYFAPHAIYLKKENPDKILIVFSRPDRMDLYGQYVDIFVPLKLRDDEDEFQHGWGSTIYKSQIIAALTSEVKRKFISRYNEVDHYIPQTKGNLAELRWQFPRNEMCYDFKPRVKNAKWVSKNIPLKNFVICESEDHIVDLNIITVDEILQKFKDDKTDGISFLGVMIEVILRCDMFIGSFASIYTRMALLLNRPVVSSDEMKGDAIHLINPFRSPVFIADAVSEGVKLYHENHF